jgi:TonB family protein
MTPLKDTLEAPQSASEKAPATSAERSKSESGGLRPDAVSLEVPVKVHGSRVTEVVRGITPHTEPFEEQTATMIVFPQGGVLRMSTPVTAGQMVVLTNLKSGHDAICRIVKVRAYAAPQSYVELEFTNRQQGYWGVRFSSDSAEPATTILPPPPAPPVPSVIETGPQIAAPRATVGAPRAARPEPAPVFTPPAKRSGTPAHANQPKHESSFVSIGTHEDVQPAAAATNVQPKAQRPSMPAAPLSMNELRGDGSIAAPPITLGAGVPGEMEADLSDAFEEKTHESAPAPSLASADAPSISGHSAAQKVFGSRFDAMVEPISAEAADGSTASGRNWTQVALGIAALLVVAVGGAFYFHLIPGSKSRARVESAPPAVALPAMNTPAGLAVPGGAPNSPAVPAAQIVQPAAAPTEPAAATNDATVRSSEPVTVNASRHVAAERAQSAAANARPAKALPDISSEIAAHPVAGAHSATDGDLAAPTISSGAAPSGELQGIASVADVTPPPAPLERIKVGGSMKPPKLVSSTMPIYPEAARSTGISGQVVIQASISATGTVVGTKVLSGPALLRQAAVDALRHWKYQPGMLDGTPVPVDITVTMAFHD